MARAARFSSVEAESEALGRGRRVFACELEAGIVPSFIDAQRGERSYIDPETGEPVRHAVVVSTDRPAGFGTSQVVRRQAAPRHDLALDASGRRVSMPSTTVLRRARLIYEYVPAIDGWHLITYHPEAVSAPNSATNLR